MVYLRPACLIPGPLSPLVPLPQVLQEEKLAENSDRLGALLRQRLAAIPSKLVKSVRRGAGGGGRGGGGRGGGGRRRSLRATAFEDE